MSGPSVVVVGGGVIGLSTAMHCAALGGRVTVLERDALGAGSSSLSVGIAGNLAADELSYELGRRMVDFLPEARVRGVQMTQCGYGRLATSEADLNTFAAWVERHRRHGDDSVRLLQPSQIMEMIPGYHCPDAIGGVIDIDALYVDGYQLCQAYAGIGRERHVTVRLACPVLTIEPNSPGFKVTVKGGEHLFADVVVNAAGPWATQVAEGLGLSLPVIPQRHQVCVVNLAPGMHSEFPAINEYVPGTDAYALYFRPEGDRQMLAGLHSDAILPEHGTEDPDRYDRGVDGAYYGIVAEHLARRFPTKKLTMAGGWAGLYPLTRDFMPILGAEPDEPGVVTAAGFGGFGIARSFGCGLVAAEWAIHGESRTIPSAVAYSPARFTKAAS